MSVCPVTSFMTFFFFSSRRRHTRWPRDWSSDVCSSDLPAADPPSPDAVAARRGSGATTPPCLVLPWDLQCRSEERRVGKEGRARWSAEAWKKKRGGEEGGGHGSRGGGESARALCR